MKNIIILSITIILLSTALSACGATPYEVGETVNLMEFKEVNPDNYGGPTWLHRQKNNCTLKAGNVEITFLGDDPSYIKVEQYVENLGTCHGWLHINLVERIPVVE